MSGQIDILRQELSLIHYDSSRPRESIISCIRLLVVRHQRIITLSDNVDELYSNIALMQFMSNTLVICCVGFTIISVSSVSSIDSMTFCNIPNFAKYFPRRQSLAKVDVSMILMKTVVFYIAMTLEAFIFCFAGEYLSAKVCTLFYFITALL